MWPACRAPFDAPAAVVTTTLQITPPNAAYNATGITPVSIDLTGYSHATIYVYIGPTDTDFLVMKLQTSADNSSWSTVAGGDFGVSPATLPQSTDSNTTWAWYIAAADMERYIRVGIEVDTGIMGAYVTIIAALTPTTPQTTDPGIDQSLSV